MTEEIKVYDRRIQEEALPPARQDTPNAVIMMAMQKGYTPELIKQMMDLQVRYEEHEARKAYVRAMAAFKANPPEILKTKHVSYVNNKNQTVEWDHAVLGEIAEAVIKGMSPHGLYHRWDMTQPDANTVKTTCIITHELGHSESTSMSGPPDTSGGKDPLKAVASTNTLLQRLTLLALTGLAAKGMDNEGGGNGGNGGNGGDDDKIKAFEAWQIKCTEASQATVAELAGWWNANKDKIKKDLPEAQSAKIYNQFKEALKAKKSEREPGSEG